MGYTMSAIKTIFRILLGRRPPVTTGELTIDGVRQTVTIRRDRFGIPYIEAQNDDDAWFGLGFCHGQDRSFQLEQLVRVFDGTLAALVGPGALPIDRLSRRVGFARSSELQLPTLEPEIKRMIDSYAAGVNSGRHEGLRRPPHELALLGAKPSTFLPRHVLCILKLMCFTLPSNWDVELARLKILFADGKEALAALDPSYPEWQSVTCPPGGRAGQALDRLAEDLAVFKAAAGEGGGSNNWVLSADRTATGRPLLVNDPHLGSTLPTNGYLASLSTPQWRIAGVTFVAAPCFPMGHNGKAAWGMTAGMVDNTDLYIEEIGPDGRSVREGDKFTPCAVRRETINVKGKPPVVEEVIETPRGPIIGPALEGETLALSLRAVWLDPRPIRGLFYNHRVASFDDFRNNFRQWPGLSLNMVYADDSGAIGWQLAGETPRRRKGGGLIPLPGSDPEAGWEEAMVDFDLMPHLSNPATGFIATANNKPVADEGGAWLGADWIDGYRVSRITELLEARRDWDRSGAMAMQLDKLSLPWREMRDIVLGLPAATAEARLGLDVLKAWDGVMSPDASAASVFEFFAFELAGRAARAKAPRSWEWALERCVTPLTPVSLLVMRRFGHLVRLLREQPAGWFARGWKEEAADALGTVVTELGRRFGRDQRRWAWGRIRPLTLRHPVGDMKPLDKVFNLGPFAWGGDTTTVNQAACHPLDPAANPLFIAAIRLVIDVGNWDESRFVLPAGQSGNPFSPHYDDLLPLWQKGDGAPIAWAKEKVEAATVETLTLRP
jgi:penicillin amidase